MKKVLLVLLCIILATSLLACGSKTKAPATTQKDTQGPPAQSPVELKLAHIFPVASVNHQTFEVYKQAVEKESNGMVKITIFPASQLGNEREIIEGLQQGTIDITMSGNGYGSLVPAFSAVGLPYLYKNSDALLQFAKNGGGMAIINEMLSPAGIKPISFWILGAERNVLTKDKAVTKFSDLKGLKIRVPEMPLFIETFKALSANPTPVPWGEVYTAIQTGVVDGGEVSPEYIYTSKLHEVAKNYSMTRHFVEYGVVSINSKKFNSLPKEAQDALLKAVPVMEEFNQKNAPTANKVALENMIKEGTIVRELDAGEREKFVVAVQPLYDQYAQKYGDLAKKYLEAALAFQKK